MLRYACDYSWRFKFNRSGVAPRHLYIFKYPQVIFIFSQCSDLCYLFNLYLFVRLVQFLFTLPPTTQVSHVVVGRGMPSPGQTPPCSRAHGLVSKAQTRFQSLIVALARCLVEGKPQTAVTKGGKRTLALETADLCFSHNSPSSSLWKSCLISLNLFDNMSKRDKDAY